MRSVRAALIWAAVAAAVCVPIAFAAASPLLAYRDAVYVAAALAGIAALALLLIQPLLIGGYLPGLPALRGRRVHRWIGAVLVVAVVLFSASLVPVSRPMTS